MSDRVELLSESRPIRALVVDDHPLFCDALTLTLQSISDFEEIRSAGTLEKALEIAAQGEAPDLVILDLNLPDVHGLDETMALRIRHAVIAGMNPGAYVVPLQV